MPASGISAPSCSAKKHKKKTPAASGAAGVSVLCRLSSVIPGGNVCIGGVLRGRGCRLRGRLGGCRCRLCSRLRGCRCRLCSRFGCGTRRCSRLRCRGHLRFRGGGGLGLTAGRCLGRLGLGGGAFRCRRQRPAPCRPRRPCRRCASGSSSARGGHPR